MFWWWVAGAIWLVSLAGIMYYLATQGTFRWRLSDEEKAQYKRDMEWKL